MAECPICTATMVDDRCPMDSPRPRDKSATGQKIAEVHRGKKRSPETREKMRLAKLGRKRSAAACEAISRGHLKRSAVSHHA